MKKSKRKQKGIKLGEFYAELMKTRFAGKIKESAKLYKRNRKHKKGYE